MEKTHTSRQVFNLYHLFEPTFKYHVNRDGQASICGNMTVVVCFHPHFAKNVEKIMGS